MITRLMSSSTADTYAHVRVPIIRNNTSLGTSDGRASPLWPASFAMKVIAKVLTTP